MKYRANYFYAVIPVIQIAFYFIAYELTNYLAHKMRYVYSRGVGWGISATGYAVTYIIIIFVLTILIYLLKKKALLLSVFASIAFGVFVFPNLESFPYRGSLVILIGITGIFLPFLFATKSRS